MEPVFYLENDENDFLLMDLAFRKVGCKNFVRWFRRTADLKAALTNPGFDCLPKVVLTDLNLDAEYGLDVVEWMAQHEHLKTIPTFIISAGLFSAEIMSTLEKNTTAYVFKPSNFDGWIELARQFKCIATPDPEATLAVSAVQNERSAVL
jgi:CheY-like chemotaxis protein